MSAVFLRITNSKKNTRGREHEKINLREKKKNDRERKPRYSTIPKRKTRGNEQTIEVGRVARGRTYREKGKVEKLILLQ